MQSFTEPVEGLLRYTAWSVRTAADGRTERRLLEGRAQGRGLVVRLDGVEDRSVAAALAGASIEVPRAELPAPGRREFYRVDLIGFAVRNAEGADLGVVSHFVDAPTGAVMVVRGERERWIPATPRHLRKVELDGRCIRVDWPAED